MPALTYAHRDGSLRSPHFVPALTYARRVGSLRSPHFVPALTYALYMVGVVLIVLTLVVVGPILVMLGGAVWSALVGWLVLDDAEHEHPSELEPEHA